MIHFALIDVNSCIQVYQRQLSKEGLTDVIGGQAAANTVSTEDLRDLFNYQVCFPCVRLLNCLPVQEHTLSDTHDSLSCDCADDLEPDDGEGESNFFFINFV